MRFVLTQIAILYFAAMAYGVSEEAVCWVTLENVAPLPPRYALLDARVDRLYDQALAGDETAWRTLVTELFPVLEEYAGSLSPALGTPRRTSGSIAHEALLVLARQIEQRARPHGSILRGLLGVTRERTVGSRAGRLELLDEQIEFERRESLLPFLNQLSPEHRAAMESFFGGASLQEISAQLGARGAEVSALLVRAEALLQRAATDEAAGVRAGYLREVESLPEPKRTVMRLWLQGYSWGAIRAQTGQSDPPSIVERTDRAIRGRLADPTQRYRDLYLQSIARIQPEIQRRVMELHAQGNQPAEIGAILGLDAKEVGGIVFRWRTRLLDAFRSLAEAPTGEEAARFLALSVLPAKERRAVTMHRGGKTIAEIARELGVSEAGARTFLAKGLQALNEAMRAHGQNPEVTERRRREFLERATSFLEGRDREIMSARMAGRSSAEIAASLSLPTSTVTSFVEKMQRNFEDAYHNWTDRPRSAEDERRDYALAQFPPLQRRVMERHLSGASVADIVTEFSLSQRTTNMLIARGNNDLREILARSATPAAPPSP